MSRVVLVTGGAGYVGSHACKALARAGYRPVTYDSLATGHDWAVRWGPLEVGDIRDETRLVDVMRRYRPEAVLHFAASAYVGESVTHPAEYYSNNVVGSLTLLNAMRRSDIGRLVFSSTCAVYGVPKAMPIAEDAPTDPINPYGATKQAVERMLADFSEAYGLRSIALRYFNAAGADPELETGEDHDPETHLIPIVLEAAAGIRPFVTIHGTDHPTPDGTCVRDYTHVSDLATAHVLALARLGEGGGAPAINLGNGIGVSVAEVVEAARTVTGRPIAVVAGPRRAGDPPTLVADPHLARSELGWRAGMPSIDAIIRTAWEWHQSEIVAPRARRAAV
ncbi:MAG: UDP-glucose 4-epimerase GalE [Bauldia sp.]|nr:UDP-glucose 4-epimerase GalE [Bauldia sp.]MCW5717115.1 UDP-glucose 4-epimerase GalE [Bauldia sp.]